MICSEMILLMENWIGHLNLCLGKCRRRNSRPIYQAVKILFKSEYSTNRLVESLVILMADVQTRSFRLTGQRGDHHDVVAHFI